MRKSILAICGFSLLSVVILIGSFTLIPSCGGGGGGGESPSASLPMKGISGNPVNMNGTWTQCQYITTDQKDQLLKNTFSGGSATMNMSIWSASATANCQQTATPDALFKVTATATLGAEATATWTDGTGSTSPPTGISVSAKATKVNAVANSATLTLNNAGYVNYFNSIAKCGKTDWAVNVPTDVLNCPAVFSLKSPDYWVVDDSAAILKLYSQKDIATADYQVCSINPSLK